MKFRGTTKSGTTITTNLAGGEAYRETSKLELVSLLLTSFVQDKFYESKDAQLDRLTALVNGIPDKKFVAKAAVYARNEFGMRSITHALIGELVRAVKGEEWMKNAIRLTVHRPDDMLEMMAYYISKYGRKAWPNSLRKGLRSAISKFDGYQLSKYRGEGSDTKLVDLFNLVRPPAGIGSGYAIEAKSGRAWKRVDFKVRNGHKKLVKVDQHKSLATVWKAMVDEAGKIKDANIRIIRLGVATDLKLVDFNSDARDVVYAKLIGGTLKSRETWEAKLTQAGHTAAKVEDAEERAEVLATEKKEAWTELLTPDKDNRVKLGYFALLRNLRNILQQAPNAVGLACKQLVNEKAIRKSLVLPFRFITALEEVQKIGGPEVRKVVDAIHDAVDISVENVPKFKGKTLVVLDTSISMTSKGGNSKSDMTPVQIGSLFAAVLYKANDADLLTFDITSRFVNISSRDSTLTIAERLKLMATGGSTNFHSIFEPLKIKYDRIIILSDMQGWVEDRYSSGNPKASFAEYKRRTGARPHIFSFDLNGYGTLEFPERQVYCIAGWSEKTLEVMGLLEEDRDALINKIDAVKLN